MTRRASLAVILAVGALVRLAAWRDLREGPVPYLHRWTETDMSFYDAWAHDVAAGDLLTDSRMRPYHTGHAVVARQAYAIEGSREPFDDSVGQRIWDSWLGEKSFYQDPLYAYVLAAAYRLSGDGWRAAFLLQSLLGLGCVALVFWIAAELFDQAVATVAGLLAALYGPLVYYEAVLVKPVLITFTGLTAVALFVRWRHDPDRRGPVAGAASGLAFLAQASAILFFVPALVLLLVEDRRRALGRAGLWLLGFVVVISPVVARNLAVGAPPFVFNATGGWTFLNHNAADYDGWMGDAVSHHAAAIMVRTAGRLLPVAVETLRTHPSAASWLRVLVSKLSCFWHWYEMPNNTNYYVYRRLVSHPAPVEFAFVAPLAVFGLLASGLRTHARALLALHVLAGIATLVTFYSISRLRLPVAVASIPFAAAALVTLLRWARVGCYSSVAVGLALVGIGAALVLRPLPAGVSLIRVADYAVPNEIVLHLVESRVTTGHAGSALRLLEKELALEPEDLAAADPRAGRTSLSAVSAEVASSFAKVHGAAGVLAGALARPAEAEVHIRRAAVLREVAKQFERARGRPIP